MPVDERTAVASSEYGGAKHMFCSERCLKRFTAQLEQYADKTYSG
ncbi:YHS domain-containing protein [Sedimenticola selenatireducens]|uniref:YHS domain-containing protein n=1 Tax=Sedimenticola selenatireducens TaxID=191960 RepID=A0A557S6H4_9GAMM|nr:YHS domain-containing protein [Sedimenticola selenatireducens]TVO73015.1 YHS domain-containing protein [Sedimenticola selenatireducens]TVT63225.1 MAG: YHS domain-containing protein [Sedimenticola selenatireducens]